MTKIKFNECETIFANNKSQLASPSVCPFVLIKCSEVKSLVTRTVPLTRRRIETEYRSHNVRNIVW